MKVVGVAIGLLLLLVVGVFAYFSYNTNAIVKSAIETVGTQYLGAPVRVKSVEISVQEGTGTLTELEIGNPPGFDGPYAFRAARVSVSLDAAASKPTLVVLKRVTIDGARAAAIANSPNETNFRALAAGASGTGGSDGPSASAVKLIIDQFDMANTQAAVSSPLLPRALEVNVPDVHLKDIGRSSGGASAGEVAQQILTPIAKAVSRSLTEAGMKNLGVDSDQMKSDAAKKLNDALQKLGHPRT